MVIQNCSETWKFKITSARQTAASSTSIIWTGSRNPSLLVRHCQQLAVPTGARLPHTDSLVMIRYDLQQLGSQFLPPSTWVLLPRISTTLSWVVWNCQVMRPSISCSTQVAIIMSQLTTLIWDSSSLDADAAVVEPVSAAAVSSAAGTWRCFTDWANDSIGSRMLQLWMDSVASLPSKQNEFLPTLSTHSATHVKKKSSMQSNDCFMLASSSPIPISQIFSAPQSTCGSNVTTSAQKI